MDNRSPAAGPPHHAIPVVSVVIPVYNRPKYIPEIVATLQQQTFKGWEAIFVDDCSDADISSVLGPYLDDKRLRFLRSDQNRGVSAARNSGVRAANGRYVAFLDSDDYWHPDKLSKQVLVLESERHNQPVFCVTLTTVLMQGGWQRIRPDFDPRSGQDFADYLYVDGGFAQASSLMVPLTLALKIPFNEQLRQYEDHLFFIQLHAAGAKYVVLREPLTFWRNDERIGRLGARDDLERGAAFLSCASGLLTPRVQLAFRMRALGGELFRRHPASALALAARTLGSRAMRPSKLLAVIARQTLPTELWDFVRRRRA